MSPLVTNLSSLAVAAQKIVNWVTTADGCVHISDTTKLDFALGKLVPTSDSSRLSVAN